MMKLQIVFLRLSLIIGLAIPASSCLKAPQFDVKLSESEMTVYENDGSLDVEFILPDGARNRDVEVAYRIGGTAKSGRDFTTREEEYIFILEGETSVFFTISLIDNVLQDGPLTIEVAIVLVVYNGNTIYQGAEGQSLTITIEDDDCSPDLVGEWEYTATYFMHSYGDTIMVGQDNQELEEGVNPEFTGVVTLEEVEGDRNYVINDMFIGMFMGLEIETPSPFHDDCGIIAGPNDGSVFLMDTLPAMFSGILLDDDTIELSFSYADEENTGGGFGYAVLKRK